MKCLFLYPNLSMMMIPPASITSLSAYLKSKGIQTDLFETTLYKMEKKTSDERRADNCQVRPTKLSDVNISFKITDIITDFQKKVEEFQPDVIAISCNDFTHVIGERIIENVVLPKNTRIIMGGVYPTFFSEHAIKVDRVNAICIGEGFESLVEYIKNPTKLNIENLWIKHNNEIIKNGLRKPIDLSKLPPEDFSIFEEKRLYRPMHGKMLKMIPFYIDIGCPYQCSYCTAPSLKQLYRNSGHVYLRIKSVEQIMHELHEHVKKYQPEYLYCSTENFFSRPKQHILQLATRYKNEIGLPFWAETRVENLTEENVLLLKNMGCNRISFGLESGCENYRQKFLHKTFSNKQFYDAVKILNDCKLNCTVNNMINFPNETRQMIFETIALNRKIVHDYTNIDISLTVSSFVPCGGSQLQNYCIEQKLFDLDEYLRNPPNTFHGGFWMKNKNLTTEELQGLYRTFPLYVRLPTHYFSEIEKSEKSTLDGNVIYNNLKDIYWKMI